MTYLEIPNCIRLSNGEIDLIATTAVGPRILSYRRSTGKNILAEVPEAKIEHAMGTWKPYGGHRLWAAPEEMPRTYYPDNDPLEVERIGELGICLRAPVERLTNIQKEMRIVLAASGS